MKKNPEKDSDLKSFSGNIISGTNHWYMKAVQKSTFFPMVCRQEQQPGQ